MPRTTEKRTPRDDKPDENLLKRAAMEELCQLLQPSYARFWVRVAESFDDPAAYFERRRQTLEWLDAKKPTARLPWLALIAELLNLRVAVDFEWQSPPSTIWTDLAKIGVSEKHKRRVDDYFEGFQGEVCNESYLEHCGWQAEQDGLALMMPMLKWHYVVTFVALEDAPRAQALATVLGETLYHLRHESGIGGLPFQKRRPGKHGLW
jgi:hypothetical protein